MSALLLSPGSLSVWLVGSLCVVVVSNTGALQCYHHSYLPCTPQISSITMKRESSDDTAVVGCDSHVELELSVRVERRCKPSVPSIIMGDVRSLPSKIEELAALTRLQEHRKVSTMCYIESWLTHLTPDCHVTVPGFHLVRADQDAKETGKRKGGGIVMCVNERWCKSGHISVKEQHFTRDVELLAVSIRPYYLPRELSQVITITVYISPAAAACETTHAVVSQLHTSHLQWRV